MMWNRAVKRYKQTSIISTNDIAIDAQYLIQIGVLKVKSWWFIEMSHINPDVLIHS